MARVHVESRRQTYRGLMSDEVLDDPGLVSSRERFWTGALTDERWSANRVAVATVDDEVVGLAMSGPTGGDVRQLHLVYLDAAHHGSGAGSALLDTVLLPGEPTVLWVTDPNPRAQAFYRARGFAPTGSSQVVDGVRQVEWVRNA
jgi:GNAT superfamily N-acetyltransferase